MIVEHLPSLTLLQVRIHSEDADACIQPGCTCINTNQTSVVLENSLRQKNRDAMTYIIGTILALVLAIAMARTKVVSVPSGCGEL